MLLASDVTFVWTVLLFSDIIADHFKWTAWTFMNGNTEPIVSVIMACTFTKDFWFQIAIYSRTCHGKVGHIFALLYRKWNTKRWTVECMAFGSGWQIHYCFAHSSKQSKCCFGEWAVTVPALRQHHPININKREKGRCPQGDCSEVHELEMSPISLGKGEHIYSMVLTSFLHKTNFTLREITPNDSWLWTPVSCNESNYHLSTADIKNINK